MFALLSGMIWLTLNKQKIFWIWLDTILFLDQRSSFTFVWEVGQRCRNEINIYSSWKEGWGKMNIVLSSIYTETEIKAVFFLNIQKKDKIIELVP